MDHNKSVWVKPIRVSSYTLRPRRLLPMFIWLLINMCRAFQQSHANCHSHPSSRRTPPLFLQTVILFGPRLLGPANYYASALFSAYTPFSIVFYFISFALI